MDAQHHGGGPAIPFDVIVGALLETGRPAMLEHWRVDSCIAAARITRDVLAAFAVPCQDVAVEAAVGTLAWDRELRAGSTDPASWGPDVASIGLGVGETREALHVVVLAGGRLIDLSLDQARRPLLPLAPSAFALADPEHFLVGRPLTWRGEGLIIRYQARLGVDWYRSSPDWADARRLERQAVTDRVLEAIERTLGGTTPGEEVRTSR